MRHLSLSLLLLLVFLPITFVQAEPPTPTPQPDPLHYKSRLGLMPPAYGADPNEPMELSNDRPTFDMLTPGASVATGSWAQVVAAGDLTGDEQLDAAVATARYFDPENDEQLHIFTNQSSLTRTQRLAAGENPESIVATDLNRDGNTDIALALAADKAVNIYPHRSGQMITETIRYSLEDAPNALAAGDFTGDRYPDLAAIGPLSGTIHLWRSTDQGLDRLPYTLPYRTGGLDAIATGDLDNDGDDDIAALRGAGYTTDAVVIYLQDNGFFPISYTLSPQVDGFLAHSLAVGDVNSDGRDDLVVTAGGNAPDAHLNVFLQGASGLATSPVTYEAYHLPSAVAIGDLDHDGREDVIALHDGWSTASVYTQTVSGDLAPYAVVGIPLSDRYRQQALAVADLTHDGGLDLAIVNQNDGLTLLSNIISAPVASITHPTATATLIPGDIAITGTVTSGVESVEIRLRGATNWMTTTVNGDTWNASLVLPNEERSWWIEARAIDEQGRIQAPVAQQRVGVESGLPEGQIIINDGAIATNQLTVTLALLASDSSKVESMRINSGAWIAYTPSFEWGLSEGDGDKTISAQFRDTEGNISDPVADSIILDTAVPTSVITTPPMSLTQRLITLDWTGQDNGSGINFYDIEIRIHETDAWISLLKQTKQTQTTFEVGVDGTHCFRSRAIDIAGNTEVWPAGDGDTCIFVEQQEMLYLPLIAK